MQHTIGSNSCKEGQWQKAFLAGSNIRDLNRISSRLKLGNRVLQEDEQSDSSGRLSSKGEQYDASRWRNWRPWMPISFPSREFRCLHGPSFVLLWCTSQCYAFSFLELRGLRRRFLRALSPGIIRNYRVEHTEQRVWKKWLRAPLATNRFCLSLNEKANIPMKRRLKR